MPAALLIAFLAFGFCGAMQFNVSLVSTLFFSNNFYSFRVFVPSSLGISYLSREKREEIVLKTIIIYSLSCSLLRFLQ